MKLEELRGFLDSSTKTLLQARLEENLNLTFEKFWDELDRKFGQDATHQNRMQWEALQHKAT